MTKKKLAKGKTPKTVAAEDTEKNKGSLKAIGGSQCDNWNSAIVNQALQTL